MLRVQFNDKKSMQQVDFKKVSTNIVELAGKKVPKSTAGFKIYRLNGEFLGDYSEYTEILSELENGIRFGSEKISRHA